MADQMAVLAVEGSKHHYLLANMLRHVGEHIHGRQRAAEAESGHWQNYVEVFAATFGRAPLVAVDAPADERAVIVHELHMLGCEDLDSGAGHAPDFRVITGCKAADGRTAVCFRIIRVASSSRWR